MNCKPGDMALVISAPAHLEAIGAIVQVVCRYLGTIGDEWVINWRGRDWTCLDSSLKPLRPDSEPESTDTPRELEAA